MAIKRKAATKRRTTKKSIAKKVAPKTKKDPKRKPVSKGAEFKRRSEDAKKSTGKRKLGSPDAPPSHPKKSRTSKLKTTAKKSIPLDSEHLRSAASKKGWVTRRKNAKKKK